MLSSFKLPGSNGYEIEAISVQGGGFPSTAGIMASHSDLSATYEVPDQLGAGINAVFGSVGRVAVDFHRQKRRVSHPEKGCTLIDELGVFRGEFTFAGERGYSSAAATAIPGEVNRMPSGFCGFGIDRANGGVSDFLRSSHLIARARRANGTIAFAATAAHFDRGLGFAAELSEREGAMKITRSASTRTRDSADALNHAEQSRSVLIGPPPPFEGTARFQDPADGPPTWTGSLSVALPGTSPIALAGPDFAAKLCPDLPLRRRCKVPLP